jgi:hypothetical protein
MSTMQFNTELLEEWLAKNGPRAVERLAVAANYSVPGIEKIRRDGHVPHRSRIPRLARALRATPEQLIVFARAKKRAS